MPGLNIEMWNETHESKIIQFLTNSDKKTLVIYVEHPKSESTESPKLIVQNEIPTLANNSFTYFTKSYYTQEINSKELFHKYVQFGTFGGKHLTSLLRLMSGLYAPLFFGNKTWPDSNLEFFRN
jgi:dynein heavy chain